MNKNYKEKLQDCRESIDRLDSILTYTLGERFQKTKEIDLDTVFAEKIFNLIVNEVKINHNKMKK
jgi:hypothetical protein